MCDNTVIIIGAGLGGLMSGALLAKEGYRVTVVEKNKNVGGGLQSYRKFGTVFDTGMHIFGGMETNGNIRKICKHLDILDKFEILNLNKGCNAEIYIGAEQKNYSVSFESSSFVDTFSRYFPEEHDNLEKYKEAIHRIINELDLFYLRPKDNKSLGWSEDSVIPANLFISKYVKDEKLQSLLSVVNVLYAGEPDITPAFLHTAIAMILMNGACRVVGGYSTFANALVECIEANGGKLIVGEKVTQICTKSGHATGVCTNKWQMFSGEYVISSLPLLTTIDIIEDSSALSRTYKTSIENKTPSLSAFIINIKLKKNSLKFSNRIGYYLEDYNYAWTAYRNGEVEKFMYSTPPMINQGEYAETLNIIIPMHWDVVSEWEDTTVGKRGQAYESFKYGMLEKTLDKLSLIIPNIKDLIEKVDMSSPLTIRDYTGATHGAMCGMRKECNDPLVFMPVVTRIKELFITGQDVNMHGFCGVSLTAIQTCEAILGKKYLLNKLSEKQ